METQASTGATVPSGSARPAADDLAPPRPRLRQVLALTLAGVLLVALSGCSDDPAENAVAVAQANVAAKQKALADAEAEAVAASAAFCSASSTYITALDRYGDVLNATAPTVGDVKDAGQDLTKPGREALDAGEAAASAQAGVTSATVELAEAEAALAAAQAEAAGSPTPEPGSEEQSAEPADPPASVARVQQAEAGFAAAQAGITDETPLAQAAEQFNSAAVALQMAWLALFVDADCLTEENQGQAADALAAYTRALQQELADAGYFEGEVDGVYGPETVAAVQALQKANGLPQTGTMDKATEAALRTELVAEGGATAQQETASTAAVQQTLVLAGYWDGPVDGVWSDELTEALETFQADLGVPVTGTVDAATITALEAVIAGARERPSESPSATPEPTDAEPAPTSS